MSVLDELTPREQARLRDHVVRRALAEGQESSPLISQQERVHVRLATLHGIVQRAAEGQTQITWRDPFNPYRRRTLDLT